MLTPHTRYPPSPDNDSPRINDRLIQHFPSCLLYRLLASLLIEPTHITNTTSFQTHLSFSIFATAAPSPCNLFSFANCNAVGKCRLLRVTGAWRKPTYCNIMIFYNENIVRPEKNYLRHRCLAKTDILQYNDFPQ
jgi:hypothetical protein